MRFTPLLITIVTLLPFVTSILAQDVTILEHDISIQSVEFSPVDHSLVVSAGDDNTIKLWKLQNSTPTILTGHTEKINSIAFSPDGRLLASGSDDFTFKLWDVHHHQNIATLEHLPISGKPPSRVISVAFSPDGETLATAGYATVKLWNVHNWTETATLQYEDWVSAIVFSPNGQFLAAVDGKQMKIWDFEKKEIIAQLEGDAHWIGAIAFSPDSQIFVGAGAEGKITLWSASTWEVFGRINVGDSVSDLAFSPDGKILASAGADVSRWSVASGEKIASLRRHTGWVMEVAFSPDGTALASGGLDDGRLYVQNLTTHSESQHQRHMVRLIYFLPSDRSPQPDIDEKFDNLIKEAQETFAGQMDYYGFSRKTFQFETDATGKAVVHHVTGKFKDEYYHNQSRKVWEEIDQHFDKSTNIYLAALDTSTEDLDGSACGYGGPHGAFGGTVLIPASGQCFEEVDVTVHELGHAFGLGHDFRNELKPWIDLYSTEPMTTSPCAAEWLDVHRYFNIDQPYFNESTTIEMFPSDLAGSRGIRLRFKITDLDGLHQAQLFSKVEYEHYSEPGILDCKSLDGTSDIVEFVTTQLTPKTDSVTLRVIDVFGHFTEKVFPIDFTSLSQNPTDLSNNSLDVNGDGSLDILDLVTIGNNLGQHGESPWDVNGDNEVNIQDLILVAGGLNQDEAAPSVWARELESTPTRTEVQQWLHEAKQVNLADPAFQRGILVLEQLLVSLTPQETALMSNYPNPFNPETWIPYRLAKPTDVSISIYSVSGHLVRTLELGHQPIGIYESQSHAAYWDGKNQLGEPVTSGVYFYTLSAGDFNATRKMLIRK